MIFEDDSIWVRQSWLDTFMRCPNRGRLEILHPEQGTSDSAITGTGAHAGCETIILGGTTADALVAIERAIREEVKLGVKWTHQSSEVPQTVDHMIEIASRCFDAWLADIYPWLVNNGYLGLEPELKFREELFTLPDGRKVGITGTVDLPTPKNVIIDWKSSKRPYKQWEKQRHAIQPSIYSWAAVRGAFGVDHYNWPLKFIYGVMIRPTNKVDGKYRTELIPVERTEAHARWAMKQIQAALTMCFTVGLDTEWPMVADGNFLCSQKWCPNYDRCRGELISAADDMKVTL